MDRILIILKKENGPRASSAPALGLNTIIFKHVYWYMQQTQVSVYRTIEPLVFIKVQVSMLFYSQEKLYALTNINEVNTWVFSKYLIMFNKVFVVSKTVLHCDCVIVIVNILSLKVLLFAYDYVTVYNLVKNISVLTFFFFTVYI